MGTFPGPEGSPYQGGLFKVVSGHVSLHGLGNTHPGGPFIWPRTLTSLRATRSNR